MKRDRPASPSPRVGLPEPLSPRGKMLVAAGGTLVVSGFVVLSFADPAGRNLAALVSPFLLIFGYGAVALGIILPPASPPVVSQKDH